MSPIWDASDGTPAPRSAAEQFHEMRGNVVPALPDHLARDIDDHEQPDPRDPAIAFDIFGDDVRRDPHHRNREDQSDDQDAGMLARRSEEHTSELQSLMRNSYAVVCLKKKI